jgi:hypothetical protein
MEKINPRIYRSGLCSNTDGIPEWGKLKFCILALPSSKGDMVELFISRTMFTETFSQGIRLFGGIEVFVTSREMGLSGSSVLQKGVFEVKRIWLDEKNLEISSTTNHKYGIRGETQWYQARK